MALGLKNPLANAGDIRDIRDPGSILGWGRSPGGEHGISSSILPWKILWTRRLAVVSACSVVSDSL